MRSSLLRERQEGVLGQERACAEPGGVVFLGTARYRTHLQGTIREERRVGTGARDGAGMVSKRRSWKWGTKN